MDNNLILDCIWKGYKICRLELFIWPSNPFYQPEIERLKMLMYIGVWVSNLQCLNGPLPVFKFNVYGGKTDAEDFFLNQKDLVELKYQIKNIDIRL